MERLFTLVRQIKRQIVRQRTKRLSRHLDPHLMENSPLDSHLLENSPLALHPLENSPLDSRPLENSHLDPHPLENSPLAPHPLENSPLAKLPTEILQQIANDLPVASAASFSLSCRPMYFLVGTQYIKNLLTLPDERLVFLNLLEQDLDQWIVCTSCRQLHGMQDAIKYTKVTSFLPRRVEPHCVYADWDTFVHYLFHVRISTTVFKMAMKHYRLFGADARSHQLLKILSGDLPAEHFGVGSCIGKGEAESLIKNGSLYTYKRMIYHGRCSDVRPSIKHICRHLYLRSEEQPARIYIETTYPVHEPWSIVLPCKNGTNSKKSSRTVWSELLQCGSCRTEYMAGLEHQDGCKIKFTILVWKDLGPGPESEEWTTHLKWRSDPIQFNRGEISSFFLSK